MKLISLMSVVALFAAVSSTKAVTETKEGKSCTESGRSGMHVEVPCLPKPWSPERQKPVPRPMPWFDPVSTPDTLVETHWFSSDWPHDLPRLRRCPPPPEGVSLAGRYRTRGEGSGVRKV